MPHALLIEDDEDKLQALAEVAERQGFSTSCAKTVDDARLQWQRGAADVVLLDLRVTNGQGASLLNEIQAQPSVEVIVMTGTPTTATGPAAQALRENVRDCLTEPVDMARVGSLLSRVARNHAATDAPPAGAAGLPPAAEGLGPMLGRSAPMLDLYDMIRRVAPTDATVLFIGESGTGKELVADTIHQQSPRRDHEMIALNCGAIPENLIESELFGHQKGAFTGASGTRRGVFERAAGGTLFLDEIVEMPVDLQVRLLRVLETNRLVRVGGEEEIKIDVRVIAATNQDPARAVSEGRFREDLLYRLCVFPVRLPTLHERGDDVALLAQHFLAELNKAHGTNKRFTADALARLTAYNWPGNVRQLRNAIYRAHILADGQIDCRALPDLLIPVGGASAGVPDSAGLGAPATSAISTAGAGAAPPGRGAALHLAVGTSIAEAEARLIQATLEHFGGDKTQAAKTLGISLKTLYNRLNAYQACAAGEPPVTPAP